MIKMKTQRLLVLLLLASVFGEIATARAGTLGSELQAVLQTAAAGEEIPVIVTFAAEANLQSLAVQPRALRRVGVVRALRATAERSQGAVHAMLQARGRKFQPLWIINGLALEAPPALIGELAARPEVAAIEYDALVRLPEVTPSQAAGVEWNLDAVHAPELWKQGITGQGVTVATLDSGVDVNHPDLRPKWRGGSNSWFNPYAAACGKTIADCTPCEQNASTPCDDAVGQDQGHGTAVMGVLVGDSSSGSAIGIAPGAQWITAKVFRDDGTAPNSMIHLAFQWLLDPDGDPATDDAPDVVNNSWGFETAPGLCSNEFLPDVRALISAGIPAVFSAGNAGPTSNTGVSPANYAESFAVGAVDQNSLVAVFSSRGPSSCDGSIFPEVVAPGVHIRTAGLNSLYVLIDGTSFSSPHVAGVMALLFSAFPSLTVSQLEDALTQSATDLGPTGPDNDYGNGLVNALAAYNLLSGIPDLSVHDPVPPADDLQLDFGHLPPGQAVSQPVTLSNNGSGLLQISGVGTLPPPFSVIQDGCSGRGLMAGDSCTITLGFAPQSLGQFAAGLQIDSNDPDQGTVTLQLSGHGNTLPPPAHLVAPDDGATGLSIPVTLQWTQIPDADGDTITHFVFLSRTGDFTDSTPMPVAAAGSSRGALLAGAGGLLAFALAAGRRRRRAALLLPGVLLLLLFACNGGGGGSSSGEQGEPVSYTLSDLAPATTYYWKVVSEDSRSGAVESAVRSFTTR